mgnify:CR=1 FL=1
MPIPAPTAVPVPAPTGVPAPAPSAVPVPPPLAAARHQQKKGTHTRAERQAARDGTGPLPFEKAPIVMETSGAFSKFTQDWFKKLVRVDKAQQAWRGTGVYTSRRLRNLDRTWSANSFSSWHSQCISVAHARLQAQAVNEMIGECLERDYPVAPNGQVATVSKDV